MEQVYNDRFIGHFIAYHLSALPALFVIGDDAPVPIAKAAVRGQARGRGRGSNRDRARIVVSAPDHARATSPELEIDIQHNFRDLDVACLRLKRQELNIGHNSQYKNVFPTYA
ncbi:hypothetical protein HAX54_031855 [Datura stramonium]|uniref:Uncharacterized protein n=1 Tax=Datura stramonium TaxID=4076 RepID=A0ABS8SD13_DATST|nr:hypothetical protein [Datura stramonium]